MSTNDIINRLRSPGAEQGDPKAVYRTRPVALFEEAADKIEGLEADLHEAVCIAYKRGAHEWTRLNYPALFHQLTKQRGPK